MPRPDGHITPDLAHELPRLESGIRGFLRHIGVPEHDVDDVLQEAFARAWRSRDSFRPGGSLRAWLRTTALRTWLDVRDAQRRQPTAFGDAEPSGAPPTSPAARHDLEYALRHVSPIEKQILLAFHRDRHSIRSIATDLEMAENTVKSHLRRARQRLAAVEDHT